jgi:hypothetical protein
MVGRIDVDRAVGVFQNLKTHHTRQWFDVSRAWCGIAATSFDLVVRDEPKRVAIFAGP